MMKKALLIIFLSLLLFSLSSCKANTKFSKNYFAFGTEISIDIYGIKEKDADIYFKKTKGIIDTYNRLTDRYNDYSNTDGVYNINKNAGKETKIDPLLIELIEYSIDKENLVKLDDKTYFTIGIGKVSDLYHDLFENHNMESFTESELNINYDIDIETDTSKISINKVNNTILIPNNMSLDFGGVAKGYAVEIIKKYYEENNIKYVIDAGSSSISTNYGNPNRDNSVLKVGLKKPTLNNTDEVFGILDLDINYSISTSAFYQKYVLVDNKIYSSILSKYTYKPVETDIYSITIVNKDSSIGDILSTSLYMIGYDNAINYINSNEEIEGIIYKSDGTIFISEGLKNKFTIK